MGLYKKPYPKRALIRKGVGCYHSFGRTVDRELLLDDGAKEMFVRMLWDVAAFSGVEVLTYCVMTNHFHLLLRVDTRTAEVSDAQLVQRFRSFYGDRRCPYLELTADEAEAVLRSGARGEADELRAHLKSRMGSLSAFMKTLKQRFSVWFNSTHDRVGTLWAERFKSVLVEAEPAVLRQVGAYIDVNPVRAGMVAQAADYRWSGFGAMLAGETRARSGSLKMQGGNGLLRSNQSTQNAVIRSYERLLKALASAGDEGQATNETRSPKELPSSLSASSQNIASFWGGLVVGTREYIRRWKAGATPRTKRPPGPHRCTLHEGGGVETYPASRRRRPK